MTIRFRLQQKLSATSSVLLLAGSLTLGGFAPAVATAAEGSFYKHPPIFQFRPEEDRAGQTIDRFGPVGIGIELHKPAFGMSIKNVEEGSPAAATGRLKAGQIIETINGAKLADIDPRIQLAAIITKAEATDGIVKLVVRDKAAEKGTEVTVKIPVLGAYSQTWPLNCAKSDRIVSDLADHLRQRERFDITWGDAPAMLFMLSTGEDKDLAVVRGWIKQVVEKYQGVKEITINNWSIGRCGVSLCEYYLRTGDAAILPVIKLLANHAKWDIYNSGWAHGMYGGGKHMGPDATMAFGYMGGGHMNACGVHMPTFLLLAKECGVDVDEYTLQASLKQFYRYAGHGTVPYGDGFPEQTYVDNGRDGGLAYAMAAAASLTPAGETSLYARASETAAVKGFYSTSWMLIGHTGGGVGELWRSASMGLMYDKKPTKYREFMDNRMWFYELSRRFDGSFGILGGESRYDKPESWGVRMGMSYTVPRKTLRLTGSPKTKYSHAYPLPKRPWGRPADDIFLSIVPAVQPDGKVQDVDGEKLLTGASRPVGALLGDPEVSDELLLKYAHHPENSMRGGAAGRIEALKRDHLVLQLLRSKDPRVRHAGAWAIYGTFKRSLMPTERVTPEMVELLAGMIADPDESLWGVVKALEAMGQASPELIAPHVDKLLAWVGNEEWWFTAAALRPLAKVAGDERFYAKILPALGEVMRTNTHVPLMNGASQLFAALKTASPEVQKLATDVLCKAYLDFATAEELHGPGRISMRPAVDVMLLNIGSCLAQLPGGLDKLYTVSQKRYPDEALPHKRLYLNGDPASFGPRVKDAFVKAMIPEYIAENQGPLQNEANGGPGKGMFALGSLDGLADLYRKVGDHTYDWQQFGPERLDMKWHYFSFDPDDNKRWLPGVRYRKVNYPAGMEKWFATDFEAPKAGWKSGYAPFGQEGGKLRVEGGCVNPVCRCADPMKTLWEKEVLLLRGTFEFPPLKEGYRYRLLVGGSSHVGGGDGLVIYINGKLFTWQGRGPGKNEGGKPRGAFISSEVAKEFNQGPVTIAATSFLRMHKRSQMIGNYLTLWLEEMKIPPLGE